MGNGQVGGNGSVEWTFVHHRAIDGLPSPIPQNGVVFENNRRRVRGRDPIDFRDIGGRPGLVPGSFVVTLTFASFDEAENAKKAMSRQGSSLVIVVPAVDRTNNNPQNQNRPKEIRIDW